jgi:predicted lipoprotein with Yx(FWY)xxD motif
MNRSRASVSALAAGALLLAGCGSSSSSSSSSSATAASAAAATTAASASSSGASGGRYGSASSTTSAAPASSGSGSAGAVGLHKTSLGNTLVDGQGRTLYEYLKDHPGSGVSTCTGACAQAWPPLITSGQPTAAGGVTASLLGTVKRSDGTQVSYNGHPLYYFVSDGTTPGSIKGQNVHAFGADWYVLGANGNKLEKPGG